MALQQLCVDLEPGTSRGIATNTPRRGNLNNGLEHSSAALVAVFDADHAPARSFLRERLVILPKIRASSSSRRRTSS